MARTGLATASYDTPQKGFRDYSPIQYVVIHHAATESLEAVIALEMGARQVSSTLIIKDEHIVSMMDEQWRAWSLSSNYYDSISLSVETCNSGGAAEGWPISEASYKSLAKVVADWCRRYTIPCTRDRVIGHREVYTRFGASYATACPGGIDLDRVVAEAAAILAGSTSKEFDMRTTQYIQMGDANDWSRVGADVLPVGNFPGGYEATADVNVARMWDRAITGGRGPLKLPRDQYVALQQLGKREYDLHRADDIARIREAIGGGTPGPSLPSDVATKADVAEIGKKIPTAEQNGAAARAAIVK